MYRWFLDVAARREFDSLPPHARAALATFMDAAVLVDPLEYQRRPDDPPASPGRMRILHFGEHAEGLVMFLVDPPGDQVLVVRIQWLG